MTAEQWAKGYQLFTNIQRMKAILEKLKNLPADLLIDIPQFESNWPYLDQATTNDIQNIKLLHCEFIREEYARLFTDHIARLESDLECISED